MSAPKVHGQRGVGASGDGLAAVARGGLTNLVGAGFTGVAGFLVAWLVARSLGTAAAGVFFAAITTFTLTAMIARLGVPTGLVYWIARLRAEGRYDLIGGCVRAAIVPVTVLASALAAGMWLAAPALGELVAAGHSGQAAAALRGLALLLPAAALTEAALATTRGYRLMRPTVALDKLLRPALQVLGIGGLAVAGLWVTAPPAGWALAWALPYLPVLLLAGYAAARTGLRPDSSIMEFSPRHTGDTPVKLHDRREGEGEGEGGVGRVFWRFTGPRAMASVLQLALQRLDILLVAALAGPAAAAIYTVAGRFVVLGQLANQAVSYSMQPRLAERLSTGDRAGAGVLYRTTCGWLVLTTWPLYLLVIGYAPLYLNLFGGAYRHGAPVVVVLATAMMLATACGMVDMLLIMAGRTSWNLLNVMIALAGMVTVDIVLVPRLGALGAAIGLATAVALNNLLPLAQVGYTLRLHPFGAGTLTAAGLALGWFGGLTSLVTAIAGTGPVAVISGIAAATAGYLASARRLRRVLALDLLIARRAGRPQGGLYAQ